MSKPDLIVAPCTYKAAKYAVTHWHYSKAMPAGKLVKFGVWEDGQFIGCILFSWGANNNIGKPYGLEMTQVCELVRIALTGHRAPVSQSASQSLKQMRKQSPGLRLVVSYADPHENHHGGIYQAMNWIYQGSQSNGSTLWLHRGEWVHQRTASSFYGSLKGLQSKKVMPKHRYLYPLDKAMRRQIEPMAQPYPKRADVGEIESRAATSDQT